MAEMAGEQGGRMAGTDWGRLCAQAGASLQRRFATEGELSPKAVADTVVRMLPDTIGAWLGRRLDELGWRAADARVTFDVLDGPACPPDFRGGPRELVRLAVFGLPGQGLSYRDKHRQDIYQQLCSQIMSNAVDSSSLQAVAARAMNHPDVSSDPVLAAMVRSFIAQREASLRAGGTPADVQRRADHASKLQHGFEAEARCEYPSREALVIAYGRLQREFDGYLAQFEEVRAQATLDKMRELRRRFPVHLPAADLQRCEEQIDRLRRRAGQYQRQIGELAAQGAAAARTGDQETASWVVRRLQAINSLLPMLLPPAKLETLRTEILHGEADHESEEVTRELRQRQREVVAKVKNLAGIIHRFHELSQRLSPDDNALRRAEANYRRAVEEIRGLDTNWLTSVVLELEALMDDLDDPTGQMQSQLDCFIGNVRTALNRLCLEIRAHQRSKPGPTPAPPPARPDEASPPPA